MRLLFLLIVLLHGLIHFLGFVQGYGFKEIKALSLPISKPAGLIWLIATILFVVYGSLYLTGNKYAWLIGIIAVIISQILVIVYWKDARYGTIPNVIIFVVALVSSGSYLLKSDFAKHVNK